MNDSKIIRKGLFSVILIGAASGIGLYLFKRYQNNQFSKQIRLVKNKSPPILEKASLILIIDHAIKIIHTKIRKIIYRERNFRKNLAKNDDEITNSVKNSIKEIKQIISVVFQSILKEINISEEILSRSIKSYNCPLIKNKLFNLRKIKTENPKQLSPDEIERILDYFIKIAQGINEISVIELLELDVAVVQSEDKVFYKFGIEKIDVEEQAELMKESSPSTYMKLIEYKKMYENRNSLINENAQAYFF